MSEILTGRSNPCPTVFCGCESMGNPFSVDIDVDIDIKVYLMILYVVIIMIGGIKMVL
mgnify:FL=1|jgi:hypothetical protein